MLRLSRKFSGSIVLIAAAFAAVGGLFLGGCSSLPPNNGPMVAIRNDSDAPLRVRYWIGERRQQAAGQPLEMSGEELLEIPPYGVKQYKLSAFSPYQSPSNSFVRVQIEPIGPSFQTQTQYWYELNPPSPYSIRVHGRKPKLEFERMGPGTMAMVPPSHWFHSGDVPIPVVAGVPNARSKPTPGGPTAIKPATTAAIRVPQIQKPVAPITGGQVVGVPESGMGGRD